MKILMIDNYDSFTYNLVHMLETFDGVSVVVKRNDQLTLEDVVPFEKIVLSPRYPFRGGAHARDRKGLR